MLMTFLSQRGVADEYEIDPKQNEGLAYQYHDVKRGRAERRAMHGSGCECCTGVRSPYLYIMGNPADWSSITRQ